MGFHTDFFQKNTFCDDLIFVLRKQFQYDILSSWQSNLLIMDLYLMKKIINHNLICNDSTGQILIPSSQLYLRSCQ